MGKNLTTINSNPEPLVTPAVSAPIIDAIRASLEPNSKEPADPVNLEIAASVKASDSHTLSLGGSSDMEANRISVQPLNGGPNIFSRQQKE